MTSGFLAFLFARQGVTRRTLLTLALSLGLMISQDAVSMYNRGELQQALGRLVRGPPSEGVPAPAAPACARYTLAVAGLRCEGCAARLRGTLASLDGVHNATVHFAEARVEVWADSGAVDGRQLVSAVQQLDPSYTADVQQQECYDVHDVPVACRPPPEREL
jgi:copper chaperone CopZ